VLQVVRESSSGTGSNASAGAAPAIQIPPPRPKRKPAHPYPRKMDGAAAKKPAPELKQLEKPPPLRDQDEEGSPTSVLTSAHTVLRADGLGSVFANRSSASRSPALSAAGSDERGNGGGSLASSVDGEDACASPRTRAPYTTKVQYVVWFFRSWAIRQHCSRHDNGKVVIVKPSTCSFHFYSSTRKQ